MSQTFEPKGEGNSMADLVEVSANKSSQELVLVRGVAGTGKSSLCKNHFKGHLWYEADHMMSDCRGNYKYDSRLFPEAVQWVRKMVDTALSEDLSVIVSEVFLRLDDIQPYFELSKHHNCGFKIIECTKHYGSTHDLPLWQLKRMRKAWEPIPLTYELAKFLVDAPSKTNGNN